MEPAQELGALKFTVSVALPAAPPSLSSMPAARSSVSIAVMVVRGAEIRSPTLGNHDRRGAPPVVPLGGSG
jgi:hypothetical protein